VDNAGRIHYQGKSFSGAASGPIGIEEKNTQDWLLG
jgi:hypothetical protein